MSIGSTGKSVLRGLLPLSARKRLARWVGRQTWLPDRYWHSMELVRDLERSDVQAFHHFLWSNHLAYAETYEVSKRFGDDKVNETRKLLFEDVAGVLGSRGLDPATDIESVFEVGCSMGYLLRYLETTVFRGARVLEGIDIDERAISDGSAHLASIGSHARVFHGDMADLARHIRDRRFQVVFATGVLIYLQDEDANQVVRTMLESADELVVLTGLAHPSIDNRTLQEALRRPHDGAIIQNLDAMVERAGGTVVHRRWEGARMLDGNTVYFVVAVPGGRHAPERNGDDESNALSGPKLASGDVNPPRMADSAD